MLVIKCDLCGDSKEWGFFEPYVTTTQVLPPRWSQLVVEPPLPEFIQVHQKSFTLCEGCTCRALTKHHGLPILDSSEANAEQQVG